MKKKLLILKHEISSYNVPTYNIINQSFDLTVGYYLQDESPQRGDYHKLKLHSTKFGGFVFIKGLRKLAEAYDVVSIESAPRNISFINLLFLPRKYKVVTWGIGFRCSREHPYIPNRRHTILDFIYKIILNRSDANIFYVEKSKEFWLNTNVDYKKIFIAPNTTEVEKIDINAELKKDFLFVGTLYRGKGLDRLLHSFKDAIDKTKANTKLIIIGGGEMEKEIEKYVTDNKLNDNVKLVGPVFDEHILADYFSKSLLCISPLQGGLSCPKSMGYGVPFVCRKDAITGGEIFHMIPNENGIMYNEDSDLTDILIDAIRCRQKYVEMGEKAFDFYYSNLSVDKMAEGAVDAYNYAIGK